MTGRPLRVLLRRYRGEGCAVHSVEKPARFQPRLALPLPEPHL